MLRPATEKPGLAKVTPRSGNCGDDQDTVIRYAEAFCAGVRDGAGDRPMALCMKNFPGDGRDERDQHVVTSYKDCTVEE